MRYRATMSPTLNFAPIAATCLLAIAGPAAAEPADPVEVRLAACLNAPDQASTAGQVGCEIAAERDYDRRMNAAYIDLMRKLPAPAGQRLRQGQRAWLAFRDADRAAARALFETRTGTMYAPMQAAAATRAVRDRALQLEAYWRIMTIDD